MSRDLSTYSCRPSMEFSRTMCSEYGIEYEQMQCPYTPDAASAVPFLYITEYKIENGTRKQDAIYLWY